MTQRLRLLLLFQVANQKKSGVVPVNARSSEYKAKHSSILAATHRIKHLFSLVTDANQDTAA